MSKSRYIHPYDKDQRCKEKKIVSFTFKCRRDHFKVHKNGALKPHNRTHFHFNLNFYFNIPTMCCSIIQDCRVQKSDFITVNILRNNSLSNINWNEFKLEIESCSLNEITRDQ